MQNCLFCNIIDGQHDTRKVYEDEGLIAINDINPQAPIHTLIIPKKHCETVMEIKEEEQNLMGSVFLAAQKIAKIEGIDKSGFRIVVNCGSGGGQTVFHIHFHLLGGRSLTWPPG